MFDREYLLEALKKSDIKGYELFPEIRSNLKKNSIVNNMVEEIEAFAYNSIQVTSPEITFSMWNEFQSSGNRLIFENAYFLRRKQLFSLVLSYLSEDDDKLIPVIEEKLWEWCELYSWELPAHFNMSKEAIKSGKSNPEHTVALFAAESAFFFAEILYIIGDKLHELLVLRLESEIRRRVITPYKEGAFWWEDAKMNWSSVCAGSVGAAAIYLIKDNEELALILERVIKSMDAFIGAFDEDGLITEGLDYWSYGFSFLVYFSELLKERTNGSISLLNENEKIKKIAQLPQILQFPSNAFVNFSDAASKKWTGDYGLFSRLEKVLNIKGYNYPEENNIFKDHTYRWAIMVRKLFWSSEDSIVEKSEFKTGKFLFRESQWLVDRRETESNEFVAFAAKGGHNDEPHNHNDLGEFILHYHGDPIFIDIGAPEYLKQYFRNETRYDFLAASSIGHSVPIINKKPQMYGRERYAELLNCEEIDGKTHFNLQLKEAYNCEELLSCERAFIWDYKKLQLILKDNFKFNKTDNEVQEVFISEIKPKQVEEGVILIETEKCCTELIYNTKLECTIEECSYNNHSGREAIIYRTIFTATKINEAELIEFKIVLNPKNV
jgi:hypothetical protein